MRSPLEYPFIDNDPDATMRELYRDKFHVTVVPEYDDDGDETGRIYVMLGAMYAVEWGEDQSGSACQESDNAYQQDA